MSKVQAAAPPTDAARRDPVRRGAGLRRRAAGALRRPPRRAAAGRASERGAPSGFLEETAEIRDGDWQVPPPRPDYEDRRVEITGPTDRKLVINALNSGAKGFMADFEDANSPTWQNQVEGHLNLIDAIEGTITYDGADGRHYELIDNPATLLVRPRGWHLPEKHLTHRRRAVAGAFMDFGLYAFHCGKRLAERDRGLYLYLPKMEHHLEAALWNDVFTFTREALGLPPGLIRATVLIETLPAAFQMAEIIHALGEHSYGLNAGRWDYIFSMIKVFRDDPDFVLPDRNDVKMTVPFMRAYTELLVKTCHAHGAFAMGGMAALIPSRKDEEANQRAIDAVKADKEREAKAGFDGTWVAHPDVVDVALAAFDEVLGNRPNQIDKQRYDVDVSPEQLLDAASTPGEITEEGPAQRRQRRLPVHLVLARRPRRGGHQQPDGGRRHGRDLPLADLAVGHATASSTATTCARSSTRRWRRSAPRSATRSGRRAARTRPREIFEQVALSRRVPGLPDAAGVVD